MTSEENSEIRLIHHWRSGDRVAADRLLRRYTPLLHGFFARRAVRNVDELVQRTLLACVLGIERFEGRSSFRTYLFGIAHNQLLMSLRTEANPTAKAEPQRTRPEESPSQLLAVKEEQRLLLMALLSVSPEFRSVLKMFYWDGQSVEEIAEQLGAPAGTVKSRLARGRARLKEMVLSLRAAAALRE